MLYQHQHHHQSTDSQQPEADENDNLTSIRISMNTNKWQCDYANASATFAVAQPYDHYIILNYNLS